MRTITLRGAAVLALLGLAAGLAGCGGQAEKATPWHEIVPGLSYVDSTLGQGREVKVGDYVLANYTGWVVHDGNKDAEPFDSSVERGEPIGFPLGRGLVIRGWENGIVGMAVGGKRTLRIAPELAYGPQGRPPLIPPNATLQFDVEIVDIPEVRVEILEQGDGPEAELGDRLSVHYTGWLWENGAKGEKFDSSYDRGRPYEFNLGRGMVIPGWDMAMLGMRQGTKARLIVPPVMAYGKQGSGSIPPNATLCFEVELVKVGE